MSEINFDLIEATRLICKRPGFGWELVAFDEIDSTNTFAKTHSHEFNGPTLVVARHQTAGRGRGSNTWEDEGQGTSFLSTWSMDLIDGPPDPRWTLGIGLYLFESLSEAFRMVRFGMKAPNDICIGDKKVAGILVEGSSQGDEHHIHIGIGINVFAYPAIHAQNASHLNAFLGSAHLTPETWGQFVDYFGTRVLHFEKKARSSQSGWLKQLSSRLATALNRHPMYQSNPVKSVEADGTILLENGQIDWKEV